MRACLRECAFDCGLYELLSMCSCPRKNAVVTPAKTGSSERRVNVMVSGSFLKN